MRRFLYSTHRLLGCLLSLLFLMWFISGLVLMYSGYPRFTKQEAMLHAPALSLYDLPSIDSLAIHMAERGVDLDRPYSLSLESSIDGQAVFAVQQDELRLQMLSSGDTLGLARVDRAYLELIASRWKGESISRIDTLRSLDCWTPFSRMRSDLPFYRMQLSGANKRYIYISSSTGRVLSESTRSERGWAYVGALPHWIYLTALRQNVDLWKQVVIWLSALGCFMVLTGIYVGIDVYWRSRKNKRLRGLQSPYRKCRYRWHHILGSVSGLFIFMWIFSGMMSLSKLPEWVTGRPSPQTELELIRKEAMPHLLRADYRALLQSKPDARKLSWAQLSDEVLISLEGPDESSSWSVRGEGFEPLFLDEISLGKTLAELWGSKPKSLSLMSTYDEYYSDRKGRLPLPVYSVSMGDEQETVLYVDPQSGALRRVDRAARMNRWAYSKLHSLNIGFLNRYPLLWEFLMWILLLAGTVVSATGVWMSIDFLRRKSRRRHS